MLVLENIQEATSYAKSGVAVIYKNEVLEMVICKNIGWLLKTIEGITVCIIRHRLFTIAYCPTLDLFLWKENGSITGKETTVVSIEEATKLAIEIMKRYHMYEDMKLFD